MLIFNIDSPNYSKSHAQFDLPYGLQKEPKTKLKEFLKHVANDKDAQKLCCLLAINLLCTLVEFIYGFISNSMSLISDSVHMLVDSSALAIGLFASYMAKQPPNLNFTYGYQRYQILSGFINGIFLIFVAFYIFIESLERIYEPPIVYSEKMLIVAIGGLVINIIGICFFHEHAHLNDEDHHCDHHRHNTHHHQHNDTSKKHKDKTTENNDHNFSGFVEDNGRISKREFQPEHINHISNNSLGNNNDQNSCLNEDSHKVGHDHDSNEENCDYQHRQHQKHHYKHSHDHDHNHNHNHNENLYGVLLHIMADALGSIGAILSALLIHYFGWYISDAICSAITSAMIFLSVIPLLKSSGNILMQTYPEKFKLEIVNILNDITHFDGVLKCENFHLWAYKNNYYVASLCIITQHQAENIDSIKNFAIERLKKLKNIHDCTIEISCDDDPRAL